MPKKAIIGGLGGWAIVWMGFRSCKTQFLQLMSFVNPPKLLVRRGRLVTKVQMQLSLPLVKGRLRGVCWGCGLAANTPPNLPSVRGGIAANPLLVSPGQRGTKTRLQFPLRVLRGWMAIYCSCRSSMSAAADQSSWGWRTFQQWRQLSNFHTF